MLLQSIFDFTTKTLSVHYCVPFINLKKISQVIPKYTIILSHNKSRSRSRSRESQNNQGLHIPGVKTAALRVRCAEGFECDLLNDL